MRPGVFGMIIAMIAIFSAVNASRSETFTIELPALTGAYWPEVRIRNTCVQYNGSTAEISRLSINITGYGGGSTQNCCCPLVIYDRPLEIYLVAGHPGEGSIWQRAFWYGGLALITGAPHEFEVHYSVEEQYFLDRPQVLADGDSLCLVLQIVPWSLIPGCPEYGEPFGNIYSAELKLEMTPQVPVNQATWGALKSIFIKDR